MSGGANRASHWGICPPDATVAPFRYFSLLSGVVLGFAAWGDIPDWRIAGGTALMTGSGLAMMKLERRNRRRAHA